MIGIGFRVDLDFQDFQFQEFAFSGATSWLEAGRGGF